MKLSVVFICLLKLTELLVQLAQEDIQQDSHHHFEEDLLVLLVYQGDVHQLVDAGCQFFHQGIICLHASSPYISAVRVSAPGTSGR